MQSKISNDLINISTMLLTATARGEIIRLAGELNAVIEKAMEIENTGNITPPNKKALSATIKFTKEEIDMMSKTFKKEFIANGCVGHLIKRPSGKRSFCYEIRYRRNGYNISVSNKDIKIAKTLFIEATKHLQTPEQKKKEKIQFGTITDEWLIYKKGKIANKTWKSYESLANLHFTNVWREKPITQIRTADLDNLMRALDNPRTYEDLRTVLNQIFNYAIASGIISNNPLALIPFKRAERKNREALTDDQIIAFLKRICEPQFEKIRQTAYIFFFFGIRPCELDEEAHFENGFFICRNRKRKNGKIEYKKIPIPKQAQGLIEFDKPIISNLPYKKFMDLIKEALGDGLTPYNLRHTFASICAEAVRQDIVEIWMGDSPERLVGKTYVHFKDDFMRAEMDKVNFIPHSVPQSH